MRFISYRTRDIEKMYKGSMNSATTPQLFIPFVMKNSEIIAPLVADSEFIAKFIVDNTP